MSTCVIELNDAGVQATVDGELRIESPGYAIVDGKQVLVGPDAYARSRLDPRHTYNRYWDRLSLDPVTRPAPTVRNHADLAFAHLNQIWQRVGAGVKEVVFAVPGNLDKYELGLLLGIAQEVGVPATGVVDSAVVSARPVPGVREILHLDVQLHHLLVTRLDQAEHIMRVAVEDIPQAGMVALRDAWANAISDVFIQNTRFDPLQLAATEQALYDRLPDWLEELRNSRRVVIELPFGRKSHTVTIERDRLIRASERIYRQATQSIQLRPGSTEALTLQISHRIAELPGLIDHLSELVDIDIIKLAPNAVAQGAIQHQGYICSPENTLKYITSLPISDTPTEVPLTVVTKETSVPTPTHLLHSALAYRILERPLVVGTNPLPAERGLRLDGSLNGVAERHCLLRKKGTEIIVENLTNQGLFVNDAPVEHTAPVRTGDRVRIGDSGAELQLISVAEDDGA